MGHFTTRSKGHKFRFKVYVIDGSPVSNLLGRNVAVAMGLVKRINELKSAHSGQLRTLNIKPVKIILKEDAVPYSVHAARRISVPMLPKVK